MPETNYQDRVREEKDELEIKVSRLRDFISSNEMYTTLPEDEKSRLARQLIVMRQYNSILEDRIAHFSPQIPK